jgi:UDP-N-acetyl-D-mannosaminuronic acid dehydrogenase
MGKTMQNKTICVMGLGYIGLPTASVLATRGYDVIGIDVKKEIVDTINNGDVHIVEPDLAALVRNAVNSGQLKARLKPVAAHVFIIAVPTPFRKDKTPDLRFVEQSAKSIAPYVSADCLVILESTSPVGTSEKIASIISAHRPDLIRNGELNIHIAHCPERVLPGQILKEIVENDRIVGGITPEATKRAAEFYRSFVKGAVIATTSRTAELTKLVENSFRDTNIAFANELSLLCDELNINVWELIQLANRHPRVNILNPGPGVGGHCLAVDPWFIVSAAPKTARLIRTAREVNESKPHWVVQKVLESAAKFHSPIIGCLGLSYKPNIDDLRESPALEVARMLSSSEAVEVVACEPHVDQVSGVSLVSLPELLNKADIIVGLVRHNQFVSLSRAQLEGKIIFDTCGMFS